MGKIVLLPRHAEEAVELPYRRAPTPELQSRFRGRYALEPAVDISGKSIRCNALVDFVKVSVALGRVTQARHLHSAIAQYSATPVQVLPIWSDAGALGDRFNIKFHEPARCDLGGAIDAMETRFGFIAPITLEELEVSVDFYPKNGDPVLRQQVLGILQRHFRPADAWSWGEDERGRWVWSATGQPRPTTTFLLDEVDHSYLEATTYFGARGGNVSWRLMDKITDRRRSSLDFERLPPERHRARIEVTLQREILEQLGLRTLADLRSYDFSRLKRPFFEFYLPTMEDPGDSDVHRRHAEMRWRTFARAGVYGLVDRDRHRAVVRNRRVRWMKRNGYPHDAVPPPMTRGSRGLLLAYDLLNSRVRDALRRVRVGRTRA